MHGENDRPGSMVMACLLVAAVTGVVLLDLWAERTLHRVQASVTIAVVLLTTAALFLLIAARTRAWADLARRLRPRNGHDLARLLFISSMLLVAAGNLVLTLNQVGDRSDASIQHWTVLAKRERAVKYPYTYAVDVAPLRAGLPAGCAEVVVSKFGYQHVEPGRSTLRLALHPGLFGFAWYEEGARIDP